MTFLEKHHSVILPSLPAGPPGRPVRPVERAVPERVAERVAGGRRVGAGEQRQRAAAGKEGRGGTRSIAGGFKVVDWKRIQLIFETVMQQYSKSTQNVET